MSVSWCIGIERRVVGERAHWVHQRSIGEQGVEVSISVESAVIHEAVVEKVVEQVILVADFGRVEHIGRMKLVHVLKVVLGGGK